MRARTLLAAALLVLASTGACAHDKFDGRVYHAGRGSFHVGEVPSSWERIEIDDAMLAFRDHASSGSIEVHAQCGRDADDVPLVALTSHLLIGFTDREFKLEQTVPFDGREARHTIVHAKLDGVPMALDVWVLKKDGCVYDLVYAAPPATFDAGVDAFERFASGFGTTE